MEKRKLTNNQINECCIFMRDAIIRDYPYYAPHANLIYNYGCRVGELFDFRISFDAEKTKVLIHPQKNNNIRVLPMVNENVPKWVELLNITQDNDYLNKRNFQRIIEKVNPYRQLFCGKKRIGAHIFRHNWIKKQYSDGKQIATIDQLLGYTKQTILDTYLTSVIYY